MDKSVCSNCYKPKATLSCGVCIEPVCKNCAQFLDEDAFSFAAKVPEQLKHTVYCNPCYDRSVAEPLNEYQKTMAQAKEILIYFKSQNKETHLIKRTEDPYRIVNCTDRNEAILRMAFWAAQSGYNSVIDVVVNSEKVRNGSYQTQIWSATGVPTHLDERKILKDRSLRSQPN